MTSKCARCEKTVYPTEKFSCLDKVWHPGCFNCEICGIKLTMKTYKGFSKLPYCSTHYPTGKPTQVADSVETIRVKAQTERQSIITYSKEFEKQKGQVTSVADDVATRAAAANSKNYSLNQYKLVADVEHHGAPAPASAGTGTTYVAKGTKTAVIPGVAPLATKSAPKPADPEPEAPRQAPVAVLPAAKATPPVMHHEPELQPEPVHEPEPEPEPAYHEPEPEPAHQEEPMHSEPMHSEPVQSEPEPMQHETEPSNGDAEHPWVALYDYEAADEDEVAFKEGDIISNVEEAGEGWVKGTNSRTDKHGMLPSNYIEKRA